MRGVGQFIPALQVRTFGLFSNDLNRFHCRLTFFLTVTEGFDYVKRPLLRFIVDSRHVFTQHAQQDQLHASQQEDKGHSGSPAHRHSLIYEM